MVLAFLEYLCPSKVESCLAKLSIAVLDVRVRSEKHQDPPIDALDKLRKEESQLAEGFSHVLILKVELEGVS